jgi:Transglycosylase SLT domain
MADIDLNQARTITTEKEKQYGLPEGTLFKIGGIESSFRGDAVSPKGARGYFQFMEPTAKTYGVSVGNFESEADGAARYMRDNLKKYNGNLDLSLADYNGGPKAAMALARGKPWAETSDYLSKFYGRSGYTPVSSQFTTGESISPTVSPSASDLYKEERQRDAEYGGFVNNVANLPGAVATGFQLDNSVYNYWKQAAISNVDPNFQMSEDFAKELLDGIPQKHWEYVLQAKSAQEANDRRARTMESLQKEQELAKMGVAGFAGRLVGGLADLPTLIAFVPGAGGEGLLTASSRIANAVRMGLVGAGTNVAFDAATMGNRPLSTIDDLYISAAMGLGLGGVVGAGANLEKIALKQEMARLRDFGLAESMKTQVDEFKKVNLDLTDLGRETYLKKIDELTRKASDEIRRGIERQAELAKRELKFNPANDNIIKSQLIEEVKTAPPVFDRGRINARDFGAEENVVNLLYRSDAVNTSLSVEDWFRGNVEFAKNGNIKSVKMPGVTRDDLKMVGITTKAELEHVVNKVRLDANYQNLVRFSQQSKGVDELAKLATSIDPRVSSLAQRLQEQMLGDVPVYRVRQKDIDQTFGGKPGRYAGFYDSTRHAVFVPEGASDSLMLHELLHAATVHKLDYGMANPNTVHGQLTAELQAMFNEVKAKADAQGFKSYYLTNVKEFTAGLYSGSRSDAVRFHDFLKGIKDDSGVGYLSKIVDVFRKLLGLNETETNYLLKALDLTDRLIDERLTVKMDRGTKVGVETINFQTTSGAIPEDVAIAASRAEISPVFGWGLGLENRLASEKVPQSVRSLASKLFGTTIGYKDHSVVRANAWDDTTKWADSWAVEMRKGTYPQFEDWFKQSGKKWAEKGAAFEDFGTQVSNYVRGMDGEYAPQVIKAGDQMRKTLAKVVDYINNPLHDEGGSKRGLTMQEIRDPETGEVTLVGGLDKNPNYLPRKHDVNKWNTLVQTYGRDAIEGWWARAHQAGREGVSDEQAAKFGKWYVRTVEEAHANRTQDLLDDLFRGQDLEALKQSLKINGGFSDSEVLKIVDDLFPTQAKDTGRTMSSLKNRNTISERYTETWTAPDGTKVEVGLNNFVHTNAFDIVEPYLRRTAGSVAMAKNLDVYKVGDIDRLIADATENKLGNEFKTRAEVDRMRNDLKFAFDRIQGLPLEEFAWWRKGLEMWRNFNVIRLMGGAVWNQATEMSQIIGSMGWKTTLQAIPELRALRRDLATGKAPNELLEHLENTIGGVGSEYVARMEFGAKDDWVRNMGDTKMNRWLDATDTGVNKLARGVLDYTGMTPLMIQQKRVHAVALVNHFVNTANGKASSFLTKDRLAWMGLDEGMTSRLMENLKKYSKPTKGQYSETFKMDFAKWVKEDPESHSAFMNAIHRESRRVVQENDLASMIPLMGSTLGKTVFQFMNFSMHGWNKSLMFAANHRDWTTMSTVLHGSMLASIAYMGRTMVNSAGMDSDKKREYLDQRLSAQQIVANSFGRISQMSLLPNIYDTLSPYPLFQGMRTTSDLSSLASNPTYQALNGLLSMKKIIRNGISDEYQTTAQDVRAWGKLVPMNNVFPISTLLNSIANDYPTSDKE